MSCDILDHVADEIQSNKAKSHPSARWVSIDVSNCTYLLVYCQYIHAVELKDWVLDVRKSRDDQRCDWWSAKMNNFFQQNELVESRWLALHRRRAFCAPWSQALQPWWTKGHSTSFLPLYSSTTCPWKLSPSRIFENSVETCNSTCKFYQAHGLVFSNCFKKMNWLVFSAKQCFIPN